LQNLATLSHLQRPLLFDHKPSEILLSTQKNPPTKSTNRFDGATATDLTTHSEPTHSLESKRVPSPQLLGDIIFSVETTVKNYLVGTRDAIKTLQRHSSLTMDAAAANEELEHIAAAFDYFNWLMPFPIDEHTRTFYELGFSILADNSPKNSGLEFSTKPQNAQQLWKYLTTSYRPNETLANRILGAYRVYESTSHPGLRLEDSIHMLGSEGVVLNAATYAHFRDHFITNLLANAKLATIADDWQGSFLASGAGIGVYKGLRKLHLISTQYMEQAKVRFTKREITQQEFTKKIGEYVERRKSWARNAIFFTDYLDALSEGTAQHLEGSSENVFAQFSGNNKNDFHMSQDAYTHAQKILKNVDTKLIQSSVRKYLDGTSHFIPFPDYMTRNAA